MAREGRCDTTSTAKPRNTSSQLLQNISLCGGRIVFCSSRDQKKHDDDNDIVETYVMNSDGSSQTRLTFDTLFNDNPRFVSRGREIVFDSVRHDKLNIYLMAADGRRQKRLTSGSVDASPDVSPDGRTLIWSTDGPTRRAFNVYRMDVDGKNVRQLTTKGGDDPRFSPDGRHIVYSGPSPGDGGVQTGFSTGLSAGTGMIYTMNIDGSQKKSHRTGMKPQYSPDGKHLVFVLYSMQGGRIGVYDLNNKKTRWLTSPGSYDENPSWSPDGQWIAFDSVSGRRSARAAFFDKPSSRVAEERRRDVYLMTRNGSHVTRLTDSLSGVGDNFKPHWGGGTLPARILPTLREFDVSLFTNPIPDEPLQMSRSGYLLYSYNDVQNKPYPSFLVEVKNGQKSAFRIRGLEGTKGDFVFDSLLLPNGTDVLVKLGDPVARRGNPYNSYRLWIWNRQSNELKKVGTRSLFFPSLAVSPDGRYLAYVGGGDAEGTASEDNPLTLYIYDRNTGKENLVAQNDGVRGGFAWQNSEILLYTALPAFDPKNGQRPAIRPDIYSFSLENAKSRLLMRDGTHPQPSPDGKRIAFFGLREGEITYPLSEEWWLRPSPAALAVMESDGSGRKTYGVRSGPYPCIVWAPDNQRLFFVRQTKSSPQAQANVGEWNVVSGRVRSVADLTARDAEEVERSWSKPQFRAVDISPDGKTLFVGVEEQTSSGTIHTLKAIDLQDGKSTPVASLKNDAGFNWKP